MTISWLKQSHNFTLSDLSRAKVPKAIARCARLRLIMQLLSVS
ncbi:MAG: hypothetical protein QNJ65_07925 [Xenococcaceae cyanobacterium MO_234.B1]|nr:hypothetical protein [Xenococcaceae cyanobacterium MO_234.B1]